MEKGIAEDELIALELGANSPGELTDLQLKYKDKLKEKLLQVSELSPAWPTGASVCMCISGTTIATCGKL